MFLTNELGNECQQFLAKLVLLSALLRLRLRARYNQVYHTKLVALIYRRHYVPYVAMWLGHLVMLLK